MRIFDHRGQPKDKSPRYVVQTDASRYWQKHELIEGTTVIGVRVSPATVYLPSNLPIERMIAVKDETGTGPVTIRVY